MKLKAHHGIPTAPK
jgi:hypothetical protein